MKNFQSRLKAARLMQGFSMQDLVDNLDNKISKQAISRYEKGIMQPSQENLLLICQALGLKPDYFMRETEIDIENKDISYRKLQKLPIKEQKRIEMIAKDYLERYVELEEILGEASELKFTLQGFPVNSTEDIENAAHELRETWNLGEAPLNNMIETLEEQGIKIVEIEADPSFSGFSTTILDNQPVIVLNKVIEKGKQVAIDRKRFTTAHELGHIYLDLSAYSNEKEQERICNRFAGALLIPKEKMTDELGANRNNIHLKELLLIKREYGISMQALLYRAKDLEIISPYLFQQQMKLFNQLGIRQEEPGTYPGEEKSYRFMQLLFRGVAEQVISTSKAASLNNMRLAEFMEVLTTFN